MSTLRLELASVLAPTADDGRTVAFGRSPAGEERVTSLATWRAGVAELAARLAGAKIGRGSRVALFDEDPLSFSVALFALWSRGAVAVLAPNAQPGTFERLREAVEASVGADIGLGGAASFEVVLDSGAPVAPALGTLERGAAALELFTSGTTGEGKAAGKCISHLEDEVRVLEQTFGEGLGPARVYATASHQHLYGLLFRVLWPLTTGRPFCRDRLLHAEELLPRLAAERRCVLASVPAHLDRMRAASGFAQLVDTRAKGPSACVVFSSGGPLGAATAHGWEKMLGDAPAEIFGSTETGGVAHRRQRRELGDDVAWTAFEGVRTSLDAAGCLRVASSIVSEGRSEGDARVFTMGDRAELLDDKAETAETSPGAFLLRGRADRVVKIGEKRVSLPEMESRLRTHAFVSNAALVAVSLAGQDRVGAAVVMSEAGARALASEGRAALGRALADHLARDFDRVLVPRAWRYVDALPEDAQGKTTTGALLALFEAEPSAPAVERLREPVCTGRSEGTEGDVAWVEDLLEISPGLAAFEGHFPGAPIVPGVVQIAWAVSLASELLGFDAHAERIEALKFTSTLEPGMRVSLRVEHRGASAATEEHPARIGFRIARTDAEHPEGAASEISTGRLYLVARSSAEAASSGAR